MLPRDTATWIPLTIQSAEEDLLNIVSAQQEYLYDDKGDEYIDGISSWWTCIHGHCHPEIMSAITSQTKKLDHVMLAGFIHEPAESLAKKILSLAGNKFRKVFYSDNGSNAIEIALKIAVQYFKNNSNAERLNKTKFITFSSSYHGDSIGAMNVSGQNYFNRIFAGLRFPIHEIIAPNCHNCPVGKKKENCKVECMDPVRVELTLNAENYAGIVIEPLVFGATGMIFYEPKVLKALEKLGKEFDTLLIFDEVFTGMGRTGSFFAYQKADVNPDLIAFAKGLTGGALPLAATLISSKIYESFLTEDPYASFFHAHTMTGNPIACSAGLASLELLEKESLGKVGDLEVKLKFYLEELVKKFPEKIVSPRVLGGICAFDLVAKIGEDEYLNPIGKRIRSELLKNKVLLRPLGNTVYVTPPYNIAEISLKKIFDSLQIALSLL